MMLLRPPRGGGVAFRQTGAGRAARLWAMPWPPEPKALGAVCENIAEMAISIATPRESDRGSILPIASGRIP